MKPGRHCCLEAGLALLGRIADASADPEAVRTLRDLLPTAVHDAVAQTNLGEGDIELF